MSRALETVTLPDVKRMPAEGAAQAASPCEPFDHAAARVVAAAIGQRTEA